MPISACSYFQYQEYPSFMTFFYIAMGSIDLAFYIFLIVTTAKATIAFYNDWVVKVRKMEGGLMAVTTPWGQEKHPACTQMCVLKHTSAFFRLMYYGGFRTLLVFTSMLVAPGFGLLASSDTGTLYLGSDWNKFPVPS